MIYEYENKKLKRALFILCDKFTLSGTWSGNEQEQH